MLSARHVQHPRSPLGMIWLRIRRNRVACLGLLIVVGMSLSVIVIPYVWTESTERIDFADAEQGPSLAHPLGTDELGRDLLARALDGGRISLAVAFLATGMATLVGVIIGALAGYCGGWIDSLLMRLTDMFLAIPLLPVLILCTSLFARDGTFRKRFMVITVVIGFMSWMSSARLMRASVLSLKRAEFVIAARSIGSTHRSILARHLIPNALGPIVIIAATGVGAAVILESSLSFLGLGFQPPQATWGRMLYEAQTTLATHPYEAIVPGLAIVVFVFGINAAGEGLNDALEPAAPANA